ncbi:MULTISPECIES: UvrD-helicase domain-containing protein [unclassified Nocardiopsis]|uniref:UvrD-helicase domain-containing protein n=1 Tax=unclassified Nocardiopsis TaxID=2649073 RepID=UPI00135A1B24|nr:MULTISPECIES: UvrD-helicase domain-containing protein [unclassified Nocardiopsis]
MSGRLHQKDTRTDIEIREVLDSSAKGGFVVIAGAGSGKTTSLVKALGHISRVHGPDLRARSRKIACITYTNIAVEEIRKDVGHDSLFFVSTIHSFLWEIARPFQRAIAQWVRQEITRRMSKNPSDDLQEALKRLDTPHARFTYESGRNFARGVLGHSDIVQLVPWLIKEYPRLATMTAQSFPYILVDESQDTTRDVVEALKTIERLERGNVCLGFFGDPMQQIYTGGAGIIEGDKGAGWITIRKKENWRCPDRVLHVINSIRAASPRDGGLQQVLGRKPGVKPHPGFVDLFVLPSDGDDDAQVARVRQFLARSQQDDEWRAGTEGKDLRILVLEHRLAAERMGFADLHEAFARGKSAEVKEGFREGTHWSLAPFMKRVLPLVEAVEGDEGMAALAILRESAPRLRAFLDGKDSVEALAEVKRDTDELVSLMKPGSGKTTGQVLSHAVRTGLIPFDPRLRSHLLRAVDSEGLDRVSVEEEGSDTEAPTREKHEVMRAVMDAYLASPVDQVRTYRDYITGQSPYETQQGVKGAEFERVMVLVDAERSRHPDFSYAKFFGLRDLSDTDRKNEEAGKDYAVDRTRRLFYVGCSRATRSLAVVLFTKEPEKALDLLRRDDRSPFPSDSVHGIGDLETQEV